MKKIKSSGRKDLLRRLARVGKEITPRVRDEFSQMNLSECRDFVSRCEKWASNR